MLNELVTKADTLGLNSPALEHTLTNTCMYATFPEVFSVN